MSNGMSPQGFFERYGVRILCALFGLVLGILFLTIGFFKTMLMAILTIIGWLLGSRLDGRWSIRMKNALRHILGVNDDVE